MPDVVLTRLHTFGSRDARSGLKCPAESTETWHSRCSIESNPVRVPLHRIEAAIVAHRSLFLAGALVVFLGAWAGVGGSLWYLHAAAAGLPDETAVRAANSMSRATTIADAKGRHAFTIFQERRIQIPIARVSPNLIHAVIAIEDRRFYNHSGIDPIRIAGAALNDLMKSRAEQGGSTITQQLARLTLLSPQKTIRRKLQEVALATRFERTYTKSEILELYLNKAYFGDGLYGVEAASLGYFGKHASDLDVAQAALIAGLVKAPSTYAPTVNAKRAITRRNIVLRAMRDVGTIDESAYKAAVQSPLRLNDTLRREEAFGEYFKEEVRKQLVDLFGWDRVYREGLTVETTIDLDMQKAAETEVARALADIEQRLARRGRAPSTEPLQAALVAIDVDSGEVRAMVGGRDFAKSHFNRATQSRRQPGSAFKPFVYAAALERGFTPATLITGLDAPVGTAGGAWLPDDEHLEGDAMTMRAALRTSSNRAAVSMLRTIGIPAAVKSAGQLGFGEMPRVPSLALGSGEVTLLALTSAFGTFANQGNLTTPSLIRRVTTKDGKVLYEAKVTSSRVISPSTAFLITSMLQDVINSGTAWKVRQLGFQLPAAGKTGTTNDYRDAWFVGYTPGLVTGVWVGHDQPKTIMRGGYAAEVTVPLWARFMMSATRSSKPEAFKAPSSVTSARVCRTSGRLATDACHRAGDAATYTEYFARGTEPADVCLLHQYDRIGVLVASAPDVLSQVPVPAGVHDAPPPPSAPSASPAIVTSEAEPPAKKKRGFWGKLFGKGDKKKQP
jgi:1A family penicillin-binding protein